MTVVLAPDSFKGSIGAADAAEALAAGWRRVAPDAELVARPMADGGEGTLDAFAAAITGSIRMPITVTGPHGRPVSASWLLLPPSADAPAGTGVVELASTSGIELLGVDLQPLDAHTGGFGEAIVAALDHGVSRLVLGIGSSSSTDGGTGLLTSLGARFADDTGAPIPLGARGLDAVAAADLSRLRPLPPGGVIVLTDVTNPLIGASGSAAVFGPQKGLTPAEVAQADAGLSRLAAVLPADPDSPGAGAAGGAGYGLLAWGARLVPGAAEVAELIDLRGALAAASVVITGEGSFDGQSAAGKAPTHVAALAAAEGVPVALVAGRIAPDAATSGFAASVSLSDLAGGGAAAMADPTRWLRDAGAELARASAPRP
ncbi:glycerate kinase [Microbacterium sp. cf046]|uniref:glycerate kinase n=1 Tax=Microbacterium sp. cf046 TaxID=1761803 RepID=UPI000B8A02F6|nr:glycerate kinase [Microbacterium sp. cf046]